MSAEVMLDPSLQEMALLSPRDSIIHLVQHPQHLQFLTNEWTDSETIAQGEANSSQLQQIARTKRNLLTQIDLIEWNNPGLINPEQVPQPTEWQSLLALLDSPDPAVRGLSAKILGGYIEKRFYGANKKQPGDWRGAMNALHSSLEAALSHEDPIPLLKNWMEIMLGKYPDILKKAKPGQPYGSLAWRAYALANRAARPEDYEYQKQAYETTFVFSYLLKMLNRYREFQANSHNYDQLAQELTNAVMFAVDDPRSPAEVRQFAAEIRQGSQSRFHANLRQIEQDYRQTQAFPGESRPHVGVVGQENLYPQSLLSENYPSISRIREIAGPQIDYAGIALQFKRLLGANAQRLHLTPFTMLGYQGLIATPEDLEAISDPRERLDRIRQLVTEHQVNLPPELRRSGTAITGTFVDKLRGANPAAFFIFNDESLAQNSEMETILQSTIPMELRAQMLSCILPEILKLRKATKRVTRVPVGKGDLYHPQEMNADQLAQAIDQAIVWVDQEHGPSIQLTLADPLRLNGHPNNLHIQGRFRQELLTKVVFDQQVADLPIDLQTIIELIALRLFETSFCPPLNEVQVEVDRLQQTNESSPRPIYSIPGRIVHVGLRPGGQGMYTQLAEENLQTAIAALNQQTGLNLAAINAAHHSQDHDDPRFLTFRRPTLVTSDEGPHKRSNPAFFLSPVDA